MATKHENLCAALRTTDPSTMTTPEVVTFLSRAVPGCGLGEMSAALRAVAHERITEAAELERYGRRRKAGIARVVSGGKP